MFRGILTGLSFDWVLRRKGPELVRCLKQTSETKLTRVREMLSRHGEPMSYGELKESWLAKYANEPFPQLRVFHSNYARPRNGIVAFGGRRFCATKNLPVLREERREMGTAIVDHLHSLGRMEFQVQEVRNWFPHDLRMFSEPVVRTVIAETPGLRATGPHKMKLVASEIRKRA